MLFSKAWWKAMFVRMLRTAGQVGAASFTTTTIMLNEVNWLLIGSTIGLSCIVSFFTSLANLPEVEIKTNDSTSEG